MEIASKPLDEETRLKELYSYNILDTQDESDYNELVELASFVGGCQMAAITFIDAERQWIKAEKNLGIKEMPRIESFCSHTILQEDILVIEDAKSDERFFDNPLVTGSIKVGFYAGAPIVTSTGKKIGAVCILDEQSKKLSEKQIELLKVVAKLAGNLVELRITNKEIIKNAGKLLQEEKKTAQLNFEKIEKENSETAYLLHEKIAQTLVAIKFYINFARSSETMADHFLEKSVNEIVILTDTITSLSRSITPTTYDHDNYKDHIEDMIVKFGKENKIVVHFRHDEDMSRLEGHLGLLTFRIIQDALQLAKLSFAKKIQVTLKTEKNIGLRFNYEGETNIKKLPEECKMQQTNIINRVGMLGGMISMYIYQSKENRIKIDLPFPEQK
jgi:glucose-6-phosphate-specific signal transduction histidine kinase